MKKFLIRSRVRPNAYHGSLLAGPSAIDEVVAEANEAITVLEWFAHLEGGEQIVLRLRGEGRDQAFNEVVSLVQGLAYSMVDAEVAEIVDRTVEGAVFGLLASGGIGATTKAPGVTALAALAGALAGARRRDRRSSVSATGTATSGSRRTVGSSPGPRQKSGRPP